MADIGIDTLTGILVAIWEVTAQMAAFLILGFLVAGLLSIFIDPKWLERHLGGRGLGPVLRASLFGVPLPLCSCGVIPVAASLRSHGASKAATTAFLLSTPQTGVDSIMITYTMLGPLFAVFRPVMALLTGLLGGSAVQLLDSSSAQTASSMESSSGSEVPDVRGFLPRLKAALEYGLVTLPADIGKALLVGVVIAGVLSALIPADFLARYLGQGALSIALMMLVGIPLYVCATASVPLAVGFIMIGASPGAALAFLIAGPATNAATITTIGKVLGRKTTIIYLATVAVSAFFGGLLLNWLLPWVQTALPAFSFSEHHHEQLGWFDHLSAGVLIVVMTRAWWLARQNHCGCDGESCDLDSQANQLQLEVTGMNCSHCSASVQRILQELPGVISAQVSLEEGRAVVQGNNLDTPKMIQAVAGLGYQAKVIP